MPPKSLSILLSAATLCLTLLAFGCRTGASNNAATALATAPSGGPNLCVAVRGDDGRIFAQTAALTKILELQGPIDALAGGGSAAPTLFLYDSILANPSVRTCGVSACTPRQVAERAALLLKSLAGYVAARGSIGDTTSLLGASVFKEQADAHGVPKLLAVRSPAARQALLATLDEPTLRRIVPPSTRAWLQASKHPASDASRLYEGMNGLVQDALRPPLIDGRVLAKDLVAIGDFYAATNPATRPAWDHFINGCVEASKGSEWIDVARSPTNTSSSSRATTCGRTFLRLVQNVRNRDARLSPFAKGDSRASLFVGDGVPMLLGTGVMEASGGFTLGYFGRSQDLKNLTSNRRLYRDMKTQQTRSLGPATWGDALTASMTLPGVVSITGSQVPSPFVGGWADPHPVQALRNLGCETVVFVTRQGDDPALEIARNLGVGDEVLMGLYAGAPENAGNARALALREADGVWCTDWSAFRDQQIIELVEDAGNAPLSRGHLPAGLSAYPETRDHLDAPGCSAGPEPKMSQLGPILPTLKKGGDFPSPNDDGITSSLSHERLTGMSAL